MNSEIPANGAWRPEQQEHMDRIEMIQRNYGGWRKRMEEAKRAQPVPLPPEGSWLVRGLEAILLWLKGRRS
jgi:hypothetical protein